MMCLSVRRYSRRLAEKTLLICCNDCRHIDELGARATVLTSLASGVAVSSGFDASLFRYYIETGQVRQVVVAGHSGCRVIRDLLDDRIRPDWLPDTRKQLQDLEFLFGTYSRLSPESRLGFLFAYVSIQVSHLRSLLCGATAGVHVQGIVISGDRVLTDCCKSALWQVPPCCN